jgi:iron complex outermembrane receptor protein
MTKLALGSRKRTILRMFAGLVTASACQLAFSQDNAAKATVADETVELPAFTINETPANPYQSGQALSSSRIAMSVMDIPQTISVVTNELISDTLGARMLDVAKYVTPIVESTLPFGGDRYMIRGFQVSQEFIDGTVISGADGYSMSLAPYNIERIEVLKGPNAILVPGGSPGGVMNPITKEPIGKNQSSMTLELAEFSGNAFSFDVNRILNTKNNAAVRIVAAGWKNTHLYIKNQYRNGFMIAPSFSMQLSPMHKLIVKAEFVENRETNLAGLPVDPSVGTGQYAKIASGLPRDWSFGNHADARKRSTDRVSAELRSTLSEHVTSRLYIMADEVRRIDVGGTGAAVANYGGSSRNPYTGAYEPGVTWATTANTDGTLTATKTLTPITDPSTWTYTRSNSKVDLEYTEAHSCPVKG